MEGFEGKEGCNKKLEGLAVYIVQYQLLWDYLETMLGYITSTKLMAKRKEDVKPPTFDRLYYSFQGMKTCFLTACRHIIGLDG